MKKGSMIEESEPPKAYYQPKIYNYPSMRHTLGAVLIGLMGGLAGPVPLQVRNGLSNAGLPEDAWIEVPTVVDHGSFAPRSVSPLPRWLFNQIETVIFQRKMIADWLVRKDRTLLEKALLAWPEAVPIEDLLAFAKQIDREG